MATLDTSAQLTLTELAKRSNLAQIITIAEVLSKRNAILEDAVWVESNQPTSHVTTRRAALPRGTLRKINAGIAREASQTVQIKEPMCMIEAYSVVDSFLIQIASNPAAFRSGEDKAFIEGIGQRFAALLLEGDVNGTDYGSSTITPEGIDGFPCRYAAYADANVTRNSTTEAGADDTSIWVIQWGEDKVHLIYPKGSTVGISSRDLGECTVQAGLMLDTTNIRDVTEYQAYRTHFKLHFGLVVRDDRCVQRLCNIDSVRGGTYAFDQTGSDGLIEALNNLPARGDGEVIYVNRTLKTQFDILSKDKTNVAYTSAEVFGKPVTFFQGVPVKLCDAISDTEDYLAS